MSNYEEEDDAYDCPVSSIRGATLAKAKRELGEIPHQRLEMIGQLRDKIHQWSPTEGNTAPDFVRKDDDKFLLAFLRARKFDLDKALSLFVNYHVYRQRYASILGDFDAISVKHILENGVIGILDTRLYNGSKVVCVYPERWDFENVPFIDNFRATLLLLDKLIEDEETQVHGLSILYNFEGSSFYSMIKVAQSEVVKNPMLIQLLQDAFPARFKGVHVINQPWYVSMVLSIIRPFMKEKLKQRIHMHGTDFDSLHKHINPEDLPADFGGRQPLLRRSSTIELFQDELSQVSAD